MLTINDATRQANDADEKHESGIARRIYIIIIKSGIARRGSSKRTESGITRRGYASVYIILSQA